jgi:hypothetical protein
VDEKGACTIGTGPHTGKEGCAWVKGECTQLGGHGLLRKGHVCNVSFIRCKAQFFINFI